MPQTFAIILNAGSGSRGTEEKLQQLKAVFAVHNLKPEIFLAHDSVALTSNTQKALSLGYGVIVAAGGDGTVSAVAAELLGKNSALGILPMGTLNHLAKDLGIPSELTEAIKVLISGKVITIDAGQVNGKVFVNNSSIGLYSKLVQHRERHQALGKSKWWAVVSAIRSVMNNYSYFKVKIEISGKDMYLKSPFVFVGNNKYKVEGLDLGSRTEINKQQLSLFVAHHSSKFGLLVLAYHALFGGLVEHKDFDAYVVKQVTITTEKKFLPVALDGEVVTLPTPLEYKILPQALKVITS